MHKLLVMLPFCIVLGCGPSKHERTLSTLNTEADRWDGSSEFETSAMDAFGNMIIARVEKSTLNYDLELRSAGPDRLPRNRDDIIVTRSKPHGDTTYTKEAAKAVGEVTKGATSGAIKGIKEGLGFGKEKKE